MIKIPKVSNGKLYQLTDKGVEVVRQNGQSECLIANRSLKIKFEDNGWTLSADGNIIKNKKLDDEKTSKTKATGKHKQANKAEGSTKANTKKSTVKRNTTTKKNSK